MRFGRQSAALSQDEYRSVTGSPVTLAAKILRGRIVTLMRAVSAEIRRSDPFEGHKVEEVEEPPDSLSQGDTR